METESGSDRDWASHWAVHFGLFSTPMHNLILVRGRSTTRQHVASPKRSYPPSLPRHVSKSNTLMHTCFPHVRYPNPYMWRSCILVHSCFSHNPCLNPHVARVNGKGASPTPHRDFPPIHSSRNASIKSSRKINVLLLLRNLTQMLRVPRTKYIVTGKPLVACSVYTYVTCRHG